MESASNVNQLFAELKNDGLRISTKIIHDAQNGDGVALCDIGNEYYDGENYEKALTWYKLAAANDYSYGQYWTGEMYQNGDGVQVDYKVAMEWYLKAAENNQVDAFLKLGEMFEKGLGVAVDKVKALEWYSKSGQPKHTQSLNAEGITLSKIEIEKSIESLVKETIEIMKLKDETIVIADKDEKKSNVTTNEQGVMDDMELLKQENKQMKEEIQILKRTVLEMTKRMEILEKSINLPS